MANKAKSNLRLAGAGKKRPQLNIPIDLLDLDPKNPRLAEKDKEATPADLIKTLYSDFDLEDLAYSMVENGYFDEEPVVVIPSSPPDGFELPTTAKDQEAYIQGLIEKKTIRFFVVEGNRRVATIKLLIDPTSRKYVRTSAGFPSVTSEELKNELSVIPAIFYPDRTGISAYLGVRHIAGLLKWDAYAKAVFLATQIDLQVADGKSYGESIKETQRQTADRSDAIRRQYLYYRVLREAEEDANFETKPVKERFSLMAVALNSPSIRNYIGMPSYKEANFDSRLVPEKRVGHLVQLLTWIYGDGKDNSPILTDSRKITSRLAPVLEDQAATEYLIKYGNLEDAYERSGGEKNFVLKKISGATKSLQNALSFVYKYKKETEVVEAVDECFLAAEQLKNTLKND
jgi:hypothetical protein